MKPRKPRPVANSELPANAAGLAPAMGETVVETNRLETDANHYEGTGHAYPSDGQPVVFRRSPHR